MKIVQVIQNNSGNRIDASSSSKDGKINSCSNNDLTGNDNSTQPLIPSSNNTGSIPKIGAAPNTSSSSISEIKEIAGNSANSAEEESKDNNNHV